MTSFKALTLKHIPLFDCCQEDDDIELTDFDIKVVNKSYDLQSEPDLIGVIKKLVYFGMNTSKEIEALVYRDGTLYPSKLFDAQDKILDIVEPVIRNELILQKYDKPHHIKRYHGNAFSVNDVVQCQYFISTGATRYLQWFYTNGYEFTSRDWYHATCADQLAVLQWASKYYSCSNWHHDIITKADEERYTAIIAWLHTTSYAWRVDSKYTIGSKERYYYR